MADYGRLMRLTGYQKFLPRENETALKINISWHHFYPMLHDTVAARGVISTLLDDGYAAGELYGCHNSTVVVDARRGEVANKHKQVMVDKYGFSQYPSV
jgi:hypothetical protein